MGKIIQINDEHSFECPDPKPSDEILFLNKEKSKQHWPLTEDALYEELGLPEIFFEWDQRTLYNQEHTTRDPDTGQLLSLSIEDTNKLVEIRDREIYRRIFGAYFMNNGELEYLTGNNYTFLTYYRIPGVGLPHFRKFQRDCFYIIEKADKDPNCLGAYIAKAKKTGLSHILACVFLNQANTIFDRAFGMMSKSQQDANDVNMQYFWRGYEAMPPIMKPTFSVKNTSKMIFGQQAPKYTGTQESLRKIAAARANKPLNTWVFTAPTDTNVKFDGPMMYYVHLDEFPKWKVSPKKIFEKATETIKLQQTIIGKMWITSYPPEEDGQGFEEGKKVYYDSKLYTIKPGGNGRTKSGLICHFVGALDATEGTHDIYGNADREKALMMNQQERDLQETAAELQGKIRQYCRTEEECWRSGANGSTFDNIHLSEVEVILDAEERQNKMHYVEGNWDWSNGRFSRPVWTVVTEEDKIKRKVKPYWRIYEQYDPVHLNRVVQDEATGLYKPDAYSKFVAAADPMDYVMKSRIQTNPSDGGITVMNFPDFTRNTQMKRVASKVVVCDYLDRPEDPDDYLEHIILTIFAYGCMVLIEANKQWVVTKLIKLGLQRFLLVRTTDGQIVPWEDGQLNQSITSTTDVIETYVRAIATYIRRPNNINSEIDYCLAFRNHRLVLSLMCFNPNKTKEFDDVVTFGLCLVAMDAMFSLFERLKQREEKDNCIPMAYAALGNAV